MRKRQMFLVLVIFGTTWASSFYISTRLLLREQDQIVVPNVVGFPSVEATRLLKQKKINVTLEKVHEISNYPEDTVIHQSIESGTIVKEGRVLTLKIVAPVEQIEIPNLIGMEILESKILIEKKKLRLTGISYGCHHKSKAGIVISQVPESSEMVATQEVSLLVSSGPCANQFVIQDLTDQRIADLKPEFAARGIELKILTSDRTRENQTRAKVVQQEPIAGSIVKMGDSVVLTIE